MHLLHWQADSLPSEPPGKLCVYVYTHTHTHTHSCPATHNFLDYCSFPSCSYPHIISTIPQTSSSSDTVHAAQRTTSFLSLTCVCVRVTQSCPTPWTIVCQSTGVGSRLFPSLGESSRPRDWTWIYCIAGRLFTLWATKEAWHTHISCQRFSCTQIPLPYSLVFSLAVIGSPELSLWEAFRKPWVHIQRH